MEFDSQIVTHLMHVPNVGFPIQSISTSFPVSFSELRIRENDERIIRFIETRFEFYKKFFVSETRVLKTFMDTNVQGRVRDRSTLI